MGLTPRRLIPIWLAFVATALLFTNCSGSQPVNASSNPSTVAYNGGGHSGKVVYLHTALEGSVCANPTRSLEIDGSQTQAFTLGCNGPTEDPFNISGLIQFAFDPNFVVYETHIYAQASLLSMAPNERAQFTLYCENENDEVSFAMKTSQFSTSNGAVMKTYGYVLSAGELESEEGRYHDAQAGQRVFNPASGSYVFTLGPSQSTTRASASIVFKETGETSQLSCFTKDALNTKD